MECSWRLWPIPGIYVVTSTALVKRTRATLRSAEFGFFGVCVYTRMHTPRFSGQPISAGDLVLEMTPSRPIRTSCENVGTVVPRFQFSSCERTASEGRPYKTVARRHSLRTLTERAKTKTREHTHLLKGTANPERTSKRL